MQIMSVEGRLVRDHATRRVVDSDGLDVDPTHPYWARLLADGDVAPAPDPAAPEPASSKAKGGSTANEQET